MYRLRLHLLKYIIITSIIHTLVSMKLCTKNIVSTLKISYFYFMEVEVI